MRLSATTVIYPEGTLVAALDDIHAAGLDGIELQGHHVRWLGAAPTRVAEFQRQLQDRDLTVSSLMLGYLVDDASRDAHLALLDLSAEFGSRVIPIMPPRVGMIDLPRYFDLLGQIGARAAELGIGLAVHHHLGTMINTPEQVDAFLLTAENEAAIGLCLDTAHLALHGTDIAPAITRWSPAIAHAHVKDLRPDPRIDPRTAGARAAQATFRTPGDGVLDFDAVVAALLSSDQAPWLSIEIETFHRPALESLRTAASTLKGASQ
ncbi:MAG: sugar phosphate isomerase/epimerase [Mycobacterium sp.]